MKSYNHLRVEKKWQQEWAKKKLYTTKDSVKGKKNEFVLVEFPYPSGNLHVGHWYAFAVPDMYTRFRRMQGMNVLYPIGFDAFGLPAENAAIKRGINPRTWTYKNIAHMRKQIESMGTSFDWNREVITCDPAYYKWTQSLFLQLYKKGLVYRKPTMANWCPSCKTVLANEQVVSGTCERCSSDVLQREMPQWNIRITQYADRLVDDLAPLDWPDAIKDSQRNWIGRSEGAEINFQVVNSNSNAKKENFVILHGFTGRADKNFLPNLKKSLEKNGHSVECPQMPNTDKPREIEQVQYVIDSCTIDENTIIVGHSLGAVVAMKVLERLNIKVAGLILVAPAMEERFSPDQPRPFWKTFTMVCDYEKIKSLAGFRKILADSLENEKRGKYIEYLSEKISAKIHEAKAKKIHFTSSDEPFVVQNVLPGIPVFTTRPDTLYGATCLVLAPEHPFVTKALTHAGLLSNAQDVRKYITATTKKTELERQEGKEKTGLPLLGVQAQNPATGKNIPVYIADYVLAQYGTGAVMAVPAHDERDNEFAKKFGIPVTQVVAKVSTASTGNEKVREDGAFKERDAVMCIVKHWEKDEYLAQEWTDHSGVRTMVSGGIEPGEDVVTAGKREIQEEAGYTDAKFIRDVKGFSFIEFYHQRKQTNIRARFQNLYFELQSGASVPVADEESGQHRNTWKTWDELFAFLTLMEKDATKKAFEKGPTIYTGEGRLVNSGAHDGITTEEAKKLFTELYGVVKKTYRLRDWIVSRQRYWGVPIPMVHCAKCGPQPVPEKQLPVELPRITDYLPDGDGKSPLAKSARFVKTTCPVCKGKAERETDTLDTFVDSSWYYLRYADPKNKQQFASAKALAQWLPVDVYSGGAEHTTMHVLYSRFWHKALYDMKMVSHPEPYVRRMNRGLIMGPDGQKMSKSKGNVIDPDDVVKRLGADTVRMYLAFIGPYNEVGSYPWSQESIAGVRRFLERVWKLQFSLSTKVSEDTERELHKMIKKCSEDMQEMKFNTAIAALMTFINHAEKQGITSAQYDTLIKLLAPLAPHCAEELWHIRGHKQSIHLEKWPKWQEKKLIASSVIMAVQVNGKLRGQFTCAIAESKEVIEQLAQRAVEKWTADQRIVKIIIVPQRLVNIVVAPL
ncbi:MAG: alpha/beta fold hydrolase [Minisyncoccia bacterium]